MRVSAAIHGSPGKVASKVSLPRVISSSLAVAAVVASASVWWMWRSRRVGAPSPQTYLWLPQMLGY